MISAIFNDPLKRLVQASTFLRFGNGSMLSYKDNPQLLPKSYISSVLKYPLNKEDLIKAHQTWPELAEYATQLKNITLSLAWMSPHCIGHSLMHWIYGSVISKDCMPSVPTPKKGLVDTWTQMKDSPPSKSQRDVEPKPIQWHGKASQTRL